MKKIISLFIFVIISLSLVSGVGASELSKPQADLTVPVTGLSGGPLGSRIDIAISSIMESNPVVSYCGGNFLVVYEMSDDIYGQ